LKFNQLDQLQLHQGTSNEFEFNQSQSPSI